MSTSANVRSIPAIRDFRAATQVFLEEAVASLDMIRLELQRAFEWIEHERPQYWQMQQRRAFDLVASTRTALETCLMRTVAGRQPSCIEEKQAHAAAKRRLEETRERIERVKRWGIKLHHEANEFRGRVANLGRTLEQDLPQLLALLDRSATILEAYAEISAASPEEIAGSSPAARSTATDDSGAANRDPES
ncbi:MAG: hypothetical protein ACK5Q5_20130 [Planctomycetaceae bacterium]